jgi:hypothetical protein
MKIVGIDVGYTNLALVVAQVDVDEETDELQAITVIHAAMTNLAHVQCSCPDECIFNPREKTSAHKCHHWVENNHEHFKDSDVVVIEAQPLTGLTGVEQSIYIYLKQRYSKGRSSHVRMLSPNALHNHFSMSSEKVERRKEIVEIARDYLEEAPAFKTAKEKDHLSDAFGFILFYCQTILPRELLARRPNPFSGFAYENH